MANPEHLAILKQGVEVWNEWRKEEYVFRPDLEEARLDGMNLLGADLSKGNLRKAYLRLANLTGANLSDAILNKADIISTEISYANLCRASLISTDFSSTNLGHANLSNANLSGTNLLNADMGNANLSGAYLVRTSFQNTFLREVNFHRAMLGFSIFASLDLSEARGLESVKHIAPNYVSIDTIYKSKGKIPESFLRGCGVPKDFIKLVPYLTSLPFQFYSCFISYSSKDGDFTERLYSDLYSAGVNVFYDKEDMKIGDDIWDRLDQSIRLRDKLLIVLSEKSIASKWVKDEVNTAFEEERRRGKTVLFPIRLDDAVFDSNESWAAKIRNRHIGDFSRWKDHDAYQKAFDRLMRDLKDTAAREEGASRAGR